MILVRYEIARGVELLDILASVYLRTFPSDLKLKIINHKSAFIDQKAAVLKLHRRVLPMWE